jgi:hypothetical protein
MFTGFAFTSLTPIVTGDHDRRNLELLATGLMGSLRYQYWLIKAMETWEKNSSDPQYPQYAAELDHPDYQSEHSKKNLRKALLKAGPVVQLFGATGWKHAFRLELPGVPRHGTALQPASARPTDTLAPYNWQFSLRLKPDRQLDILSGMMDWQEEVKKLLGFVHHYGWLGASPQNGFGWVSLDSPLQAGAIIPGNPVFSAEDVLLSEDEMRRLQEVLLAYYEQKKSAAYGRDNKRYDESLRYIRKHPPPIGYEIRRFLKEKCFANSDVLGKPGEYNGWASHIHVSHPVKDGAGYRFRLRFCSRPGANGGILPAGEKPQAWIDACRDKLKNIKVVTPSPAAGGAYQKKKAKHRPRDVFKNNALTDLANFKVKK